LNADGPRILAVAAQSIGATLVHISTDYVFDGEKNTPYLETDTPDPKTAYGRTKLAGERLVAEHCQKHLIFRIAWLYGIYGNNFVRAIRTNALKKSQSGEPMLVVNDQFGTPTYTIEVCKQILNTIGRDLYGIFHCTCEGSCSWYDFAVEIIEAAGINVTLKPCTTDEFPRPAPRPHYSILENAKLKANGINIISDWKVAFKKFLEQEKNNSNL
ncbi:MAG: sugar nucleotide-binding protein, partial [Fibrobacter sp.]|nr:sugar nucleotide-binding protein [Fibrobacter sp.]